MVSWSDGDSLMRRKKKPVRCEELVYEKYSPMHRKGKRVFKSSVLCITTQTGGRKTFWRIYLHIFVTFTSPEITKKAGDRSESTRHVGGAISTDSEEAKLFGGDFVTCKDFIGNRARLSLEL